MCVQILTPKRRLLVFIEEHTIACPNHEIGDLFGGRDHTTVLHAVRKIADARVKDMELNHALHVLEQTLKG